MDFLSVFFVMLACIALPSATLDLQFAASCRRSFLSRSVISAGAIGSTTALFPPTSFADVNQVNPLSLNKVWSATDGFLDPTFISFSLESYKSMIDDKARTPAFKKAITERLSESAPQSQVVMDLGTGPYAVLALQAAKAGAKKVYAIEAIPQAASLARLAVAKAVRKGDVPEGVIEVIEGLSTNVTLPEKVDLVVAEIIGSIASEEGLHATLRDVHARHVKNPSSPSSFIPTKVQTFASPASYTLHYALGPPEYDWSKLQEPVRFNCRDAAVQLLSDPQLAEDISFSSLDFPPPGPYRPTEGRLDFQVSESRLRTNSEVYYKELKKAGSTESDATSTANSLSRSLSGIAFWPRLILDTSGDITVESRAQLGGAQKSHWQTVLAITSDRPVEVGEGDVIQVDFREVLGKEVDEPPKYDIKGEVVPRKEF